MDETLIWLLFFGTALIFYILWISARYKHKNYDLEEYLLAGKRLSTTQFMLATTSGSLLGLMSLPHIGLIYRGGFSYGFAALAAIIVPLISALFARRLWILGRVYNSLTPAQLLGRYYRSNEIRILTAVVALLVALVLVILSLRITASLVESLLAGGRIDVNASATSPNSHITPITLCLMATLLFFHTAYGGMGAVLRVAAPLGVALVLALALAAFVVLDAIGGFTAFIDQLARLQMNQITAPLFQPGALFDPLPAAAPVNMAWPGIMVATCLVALAGLATSPASLMIGFTVARGRSHAPAQFVATALLTGFMLLTATIIIALVTRLAGEIPGLQSTQSGEIFAPPKAGSELQVILSTLLKTPLGTPLLIVPITLALLAGLLAGAASALVAAGGMISNDIFHERQKLSRQPTNRRSIIRSAIGSIIAIALLISWQHPQDPLPLVLLAGAFGLQLLPALAGLCYFKKLTAHAVRYGIVAGLAAVIITSPVPQELTDLFGQSLRFDAWPLSLHPAFWGVTANLIVLMITLSLERATTPADRQKQSLAYRLSYHELPDGKPLMSPQARYWRIIALLIGALLITVTALAMSGAAIPAFFPTAIPALWSWQILSWLIGLTLVFVVVYRLQPTYDPEQHMDNSLNRQKRRFRVKAQTRKITLDVEEK